MQKLMCNPNGDKEKKIRRRLKKKEVCWQNTDFWWKDKNLNIISEISSTCEWRTCKCLSMLFLPFSPSSSNIYVNIVEDAFLSILTFWLLKMMICSHLFSNEIYEKYKWKKKIMKIKTHAHTSSTFINLFEWNRKREGNRVKNYNRIFWIAKITRENEVLRWNDFHYIFVMIKFCSMRWLTWSRVLKKKRKKTQLKFCLLLLGLLGILCSYFYISHER